MTVKTVNSDADRRNKNALAKKIDNSMEVVSYIKEMSKEMEVLARVNGLEFLTYLIGQVHLEAESIVHPLNLPEK